MDRKGLLATLFAAPLVALFGRTKPADLHAAPITAEQARLLKEAWDARYVGPHPVTIIYEGRIYSDHTPGVRVIQDTHRRAAESWRTLGRRGL